MKNYKFYIRSIDSVDLTVLEPDGKEIRQVDYNATKKLVRIISDTYNSHDIVTWAQKRGVTLELTNDGNPITSVIAIGGMTCRSCEVTLERAIGTIEGISHVAADARRGSVQVVHKGPLSEKAIRTIVSEQGYNVESIGDRVNRQTVHQKKRPSIMHLMGYAVLVGAMGIILNQFNLLVPSTSIGSGVSYGAAFLLGLFAASSSCIAVSGGLLLSSAAQWNERYGNNEGLSRMQPVFFFIIGRVVSYLVFGAVIGLIGSSLSPSPFITGVITLGAAVFMIMMGLDMLGYMPRFLENMVPHMPKWLSRRILQKESSQSPFAPLLLGAATFFLPCGFTQSLQLYALTTGSPLQSALLLSLFALGTSPALFGLGWASTSLKGKLGTFFFQFSGVVVIVLGLWNVQNGFTVAGHPLSLPSLRWGASGVSTLDGAVQYDGKTQTIRMSADERGYTPNHIVVRAGVPVRWLIDGTKAQGCVAVFQAPQLNIQKLLSRGENTIEFTPDTPGTYTFSCSMGMYRGTMTVVPNV